VLGLATGVVAQLVYLIFLFPILLGVIAARIIWWGLQRSAVKNMMLGVLAAVLLSLATYGQYQYTEYLFFQGEVKNEAQSEGVIVSDQMIDRLLQKEVGATGFVGFLRLEAREGIRIGRATSSSSNNGVALQGDWVWFYWLAELVAITGLTVRRVIISLETPYCKNCRHWYNRRGLLGNVALNRAPHVLEGLRTKNYGLAAEYISTRAEPTPRLDIEVEICGSCQTSEVSVNVNRVVYRAFGGPDKKQIFTTMLPYPQYTELVKQVQARRVY
jgi:hypothetical protein